MNIGAVSSSFGGYAAGLVSGIASGVSASSTGGGLASLTATAGNSSSYSQSLYNAQGSLLSASIPQIPQDFNAPPTRAEIERSEKLQRAANLIDAGYTRAGRGMAEELVVKDSTDVAAVRLIGTAHLLDQSYKDAERFFARAASLAPGSASIEADLSLSRTLQKDDDEVLREAKRKLESPSHVSEGLRTLQHLSRRRPNDADIYIAMSDAYAQQRQSAQVVGALQEALRRADDSNIEEVVSRATTLKEKHSQVGIPYNLLGRALLKAGDFNQAIRELETAVQLAPENNAYPKDLATAFLDRATQYLKAGNLTAAQLDARAASELDPLNGNLRGVESRIAASEAQDALASGWTNRAFADLITAMNKAPVDNAYKKELAGMFMTAGVRFEADGETSSALSAFSKAFKLDPSSRSAKKMYSELSFSEGQRELSEGDYDDAIRYLQDAYDTYRVTDDYRTELARAYDLRGLYKQSIGKLDEAIEDFTKAFHLEPSNTEIGDHLSAAVAEGNES